MDLNIPLIGNEDMARRAEGVRPLVREEGKLYTIEPVDLYKVAYTWDPEVRAHIKEEDLSLVDKVKTLHRFAYHGFFKPSIAEVLAQIPEVVLRRVGKGVPIFFEVEGPKDVYDLNIEREAMNAGFHVAKTSFYVYEFDFNRFLETV